MPIRATRPYRGLADAGPKGVSWGSAIRTRTASFKGYRAAWLPHSPHWGPSPGSNWATTLTGGGRTPVRRALRARRLCARQDLNLRCPRPQRGLSTAGVRARGAVGARAVGAELPGQVSNLHCGGQGPVACRLADPASRAEGAIRTRTGPAAYQLLRMACLPFHHFRIVRRQGFEPRTSSLRGCCSDH